jgi:PPOX class probable F420-dependent enzyme
MADVLSAKARELITRPVLATLATLNPDGSPQVTPLWVDLDGDDVVFNTARGRKKARNLERDARVGVTVIDPDDQYNVVALRARWSTSVPRAPTPTSTGWPTSTWASTPTPCAGRARCGSVSRCAPTASPCRGSLPARAIAPGRSGSVEP